MTIQCMGSDELLEIMDEKILKEINSSRREGAQEMEFPESHNGTLVTGSGEYQVISGGFLYPC